MDDVGTELERLERAGWHALCRSTGAQFYDEVMADDGVMVLAHGQAMGKSEVVAALREAPPWSSYALDDLRVLPAGEDGAVVVYHATARRDGRSPFTAWMTSTYRRAEGTWRLVAYTQTPTPGS